MSNFVNCVSRSVSYKEYMIEYKNKIKIMNLENNNYMRIEAYSCQPDSCQRDRNKTQWHLLAKYTTKLKFSILQNSGFLFVSLLKAK